MVTLFGIGILLRVSQNYNLGKRSKIVILGSLLTSFGVNSVFEWADCFISKSCLESKAHLVKLNTCKYDGVKLIYFTRQIKNMVENSGMVC